MAVEHSPTYSSQSNGVVERAVRSVQGIVRTLRSALEERWGIVLGGGHAVWAWMVEYAAFLISRCEVGRDGKTAYERIKGKEARLQGFEFLGGSVVEEEARGRAPRKTHLHVGGRRVSRGEGKHGRVDRGGSTGDMANPDGS